MGIFLTAKNSIFHKMVALALCVSMTAYMVFVRPDTAYAATVSTLPVDIGCTMEYDADYIYFTVGETGRTTTIDRNMKLFGSDKIPYRYDTYEEMKASVDSVGLDNFACWIEKYNNGAVCFAVKSSSGTWNYTIASMLPKSVENDGNGMLPASYWYSPSQDKIYILTGERYNSYTRAVRSYSKSSTTGVFAFTDGDSRCDLYVTCIDCATDSVVYKFDRISGCDYYSHSYSWSSRGGYANDLICIFANYKISGFYEPDTSKVNTPSYYFKYQYIFYLKDYGYTFVDSAQKLTDVGFPGNVNTARYIFEGECNFYIYTSVDGISWSLRTTAEKMYAEYFELDYKTTVAGLYDLVYTNDEDFGVSIKEWVSLPDVIGELEELQPVLDYYHSDFYIDSGYDYDKYNTVRYWSRYIEQLALRLDSNLTGGFLFDYFSDNRFDNSDYPVTYSDYFTLFLLTELSSEYIIDYNTRGGESGTLTLFGFVKRLNNLVENTNVYLDRILNQLHSDLNGVNDNLALLYDNSNNSLSYLKKLLLSVDSLPSYLTDIKDSISALGDLSGPSGSVDPAIDYTELMQSIDLRLDALNYGLFGDDVPSRPSTYAFFAAESSGSLGGVLSGLAQSLADTDSGYFNSLDDSLLDAMGKVDLEGSIMYYLDSIDTHIIHVMDSTESIFDNITAFLPKILDELREINGNDKLFNPDTDFDIDDKVTVLIDIVNQVLNSAYLGNLLTFTDEVSNGIDFTNNVVTGVYDALGPSFSRIILLGGGFTLLAVAIKKERAT